MTIDVINYTDEQLAELGEEQILEVKSAQLKKNKLESALAEKLATEKQRLIERGIFLSKTFERYCEVMTKKKDEEVELIKEALAFYLRFTARTDKTSGYLVDYALTYDERKNIVREYYMTTFTDPTERFKAFKEDPVAKVYLGDWYPPMYDYFLALAS